MRVKILGVNVDVITEQGLVDAIKLASDRPRSTIIVHANLHGVHQYHRDEATRRVHQDADIIYIDGMAIVWWGRLMGLGVARENRFTFLDYQKLLLKTADELAWRLYYLGGKPNVADKAAATLMNQYKNIVIQCHHGYFDDENEEQQAIRQILAFKPHLLLVGLGMPKQERWILKNQHHFSSMAIMAVGAAFDYVADEIATPPRWLSHIGLEWACRLFAEPYRLAHRYLVEPWSLVPHAMRDIVMYRARPRSKLGVGH